MYPHYSQFRDPGVVKLPYPKHSLFWAHENGLKPIEEPLKHGQLLFYKYFLDALMKS